MTPEKNQLNLKKNENTDYKIFVDGSGFNEGISATAILYHKNSIWPIKSLQYFLGLPTQHNTYEAKACCALLVLWILENTAETIGKKVSLYLDNQAVIKAIKSHSTHPCQYLLQHISASINRLNTNLTIYWISSHSNIKGNEKFNQLAKKAAEDKSSAAITSHNSSDPHSL